MATGADPRTGGEGGDRLPLDVCWPKIETPGRSNVGFYQSQNAPKLAFLSLKIKKKNLGRGTAPAQTPTPVGRVTRLPTPTPSAPSQLLSHVLYFTCA